MLGRLSPLGGGGGKVNEVNVISYNVLSSSLSSPSHFQKCSPKNLKAENRYGKLTLKLEEQVKRRAVICLQEVSTSWAGRLHSYFQKEGYHFISSHYTKGWQGYLGSAIAFPNKSYTAEDVEIVRVADTKPWPAPPAPPTFLDRISGTISGILGSVLGKSGKEADHWDLAKRRMNTMICARLKSRASGKSFCIGTYHMPCMFWAPKVMVIHTALACQKIQDFAKDDHCVLAGDFNFKPGDASYLVATNGSLEESNGLHPGSDGTEWEPTLAIGFESAYKTFNDAEPDFTNYAQIREDPVFIETLDYIFHSQSLRVTEVLELPHRKDVDGPLPNEEEPSDHIMLGATFEL